MEYGNLAVVFMVLAVVIIVLGLALLGTYCLNKAVDQNSA